MNCLDDARGGHLSRIAFYILCSGEVLLSLFLIVIGSDETPELPASVLLVIWLIYTILFVIAGVVLLIRSARSFTTQRINKGEASL